MIPVSVVVPLYRSRGTVTALHQRLCDALGEERFEILFVDDHCPERSYDVAEQLAGTDPRVRAVRLQENVGQQRAVVFGVSAARGAHVVVMDADLQDDPAVVPTLLARARAGADVVFATRAGRYQSAPRLLTSRAFKRLLTLLTGLPDNAGMFLVMTADVARKLTAHATATPYVVFLAAHGAGRVDAVTVGRSARTIGSSAYTSLGRLRAALAALRCVAATRIGVTTANAAPAVERSVAW